jgi:hypothetical protein
MHIVALGSTCTTDKPLSTPKYMSTWLNDTYILVQGMVEEVEAVDM